ncbi:MAG: hypothetical protein LBO06_07535 [Bacteroidales bacterium]|jgi:hypothetical protein|nr:hypothetical protein [Bacteroidales bacterium]
MSLKHPKYHFKCGWQMKVVLSVSLLSAVVFTLFNIYISFYANSIRSIEDNSWLATRLFFIREGIVTNLNNGGRGLYVLSVFFSLTLIYGAIRMWIGRIWGLLFYSASKIALVVLPILFLGEGGIGSGDVMLALFFLLFYSIYILTHKLKLE